MRFQSATLRITLDLDVGTGGDAIVRQGAMRVEEAGQDAVVVPVGGLRGCG